MRFAIQRGVYSLNCFGDLDVAGDVNTSQKKHPVGS